MNSSTIVTFLVSVCVLAAVIESNVQVFTKQQLIDKLPLHEGNFQAHAAINTGYPEDCNSSIIPPDDGSGAYGDLIYMQGNQLGSLLLSEILLNVNISSEEEIVFWKQMFYSKCVSHVRVLNFGRERAFTKYIYANYTKSEGTNVDINVIIPANKAVRMIIEVYGKGAFGPKYCD
ncbi:hypothetical protein ILUMI_11236 [Ignelater luminosus]|uniref:Uncharacterized protein n=1 Tax=Ignelater luminosus TaxID=2038154 RepID=A0A8K0D5E9_IGNLU|nr:hypothetical protein ILUMI_11236 [Ignelater luminosus]